MKTLVISVVSLLFILKYISPVMNIALDDILERTVEEQSNDICTINTNQVFHFLKLISFKVFTIQRLFSIQSVTITGKMKQTAVTGHIPRRALTSINSVECQSVMLARYIAG